MTDVKPEKVQEALELLGAKNPGRWICDKYRNTIEEALSYDQIGGAGLLKFESFAAAVIDDVVRDKISGKGDLWTAIQTAPETAMSALQFAAQCKLLPGSKYGLVYFIPRRRKGRLEVNAQLGYKGLCTMSRRHERVHSVEAFLVYEGEEFELDAGSGKVRHLVNLMGDRSDDKIIGGYMRAIVTEEASKHAVIDAPIIWPMSRDEILKRRACSDAWEWAERGDRSKGGGKKDSPWHLWFPEQCRKTILIGGLNHGSVPQDMGVGGAIRRDQEADLLETTEDRPKLPSRAQEARARLGIVDPSTESADVEIGEQEPFSFAEEACGAADRAGTDGDLAQVERRSLHFTGADREMVDEALQRRREELRA